MTDCVLIVDGRAHEIWRCKTKADMPPFHLEFMMSVVEVDYTVAEGDVYDGASFAKPVVDPKAEASAALALSDKNMIRVVEDIWDVLKAKGVVTDDDLPQAARDQLIERRGAREALKE